MQAVLNWLLLINIQTAGGSSWSKSHTQHYWQISDLQGKQDQNSYELYTALHNIIIDNDSLSAGQKKSNGILKITSLSNTQKQKKKLQRQQKCAEQLHKDIHALEVFHHLLQL